MDVDYNQPDILDFPLVDYGDEDDYSQEEDPSEYYEAHVFSRPPFMEFLGCMSSVLMENADVAKAVNVLWCCLLLRLIAAFTYLPAAAVPLVSATFGAAMLYHHFEADLVYILFPAIFGYAAIFLTQRSRISLNSSASNKKSFTGSLIFCLCVAYILFLQFLLLDAKRFTKIMGSLIIVIMKIISLSFDLDAESASKLKVPSPIYYSSYLLCVSNTIFGPWLSFSEHQRLLQPKNTFYNFRLLGRTLLVLLMSFSCLLYCTCGINWIFLGHYPKWILAYSAAQAFRFSHYFTSLFGESTVLIAGYSPENTVQNKNGFQVVQPMFIEVPRSLVEVVVHWNIPMHRFLHRYVFRTTLERVGFAWVAIGLTYFVSTLLHGLNFQIFAVLFSLGLYTYTEQLLRDKLAAAFSACIRARACASNGCGHVYRNWHPIVLFVNAMFTSLAVFHLAYLGCVFEGNIEDAERGFSMSHTLAKWGELNYASFWVGIVLLIVAKSV